jgi:hypothetical protein
MFWSWFIGLAVKDGDFGIGADALQLGAGPKGHGLTKARRDGAGFLDDFDDGGGFAHLDDSAGLAGVLDKVTGAEGVRIGHRNSWGMKVERKDAAARRPYLLMGQAATASGVLALVLRFTRAG